MALKNKYQREKQQYSNDSGHTWIDVSPANYRRGRLIEAGSEDCNTVEWKEVTGSWFCIGFEETEYRWVTVSGQYECVGYDKYTKEKKQQSTDGGTTWTDVVPLQTRAGSLIQANSVDCGYVPPTPGGYENQYLTFEAIDNCTFKSTNTETLFYSQDNGSTWKQCGSRGVSVTAGSRVLWKAKKTFSSSSTYNVKFHRSTGRFNVYGNIMSLIYSDNFIGQTVIPSFVYFKGLFGNDGYGNYANVINAENLILPATTLTKGCYSQMFEGCTSLTTAPALPATTLAVQCYDYMFASCTNLTSAPQLPATTLADYCYNGMFIDCRSLTSAPVLPATTLTEGCYQGMFEGCTSLTTAPVLSATTLADWCYCGMFEGCTSLTTAPQLPATTLASSCYSQMFSDCSSLTTAPALPATTLPEYCYWWMFGNCTSLVNVPSVLPATTLAERCCEHMFYNCTSLTTAPALPATTLVTNCYTYMFWNCTSLNYIKAMFTTKPGSNYTYQWVLGVASTGTFVKNSAATWNVTSEHGIPEGWTVVTE